MRELLLLIILLSPFARLNCQEDHLIPEEGLFSTASFTDKYFISVKNCLFPGLNFDTQARLIVLPSFSNEYVLSVDKKGNKSYLTYRVADEQIWQSKNRNVRYKELEIPVDDELASDLQNLLSLAISKTKYSNNSVSGCDGTDYYFSTFILGEGVKCGKAWSPNTERISELVVIFDWLRECALKTENINNEDYRRRIKKLQKMFEVE
jgi:hypothetical protein